MTSQPLFDETHLRKLCLQPGDVLVLELPEGSDVLSQSELADIDAQISTILGFEAKVIVIPPGAKLQKQAEELQMGAALTADQVRAACGFDPAMPGENRTATADPSSWGTSVREATKKYAEETTAQYTERRNAIPIPPATFRVLLNGKPLSIAGAFCSPWYRVGMCQITSRRIGNFQCSDHGMGLVGCIVRIEHHGDGEAFDAVVNEQDEHGVFAFTSNGAPTPLDTPDSVKDAGGIMPSVMRAAVEGIRDRETPSGDSNVAALAEAAACPEEHHLKDGDCADDYCHCRCPRCRVQCESRAR